MKHELCDSFVEGISIHFTSYINQFLIRNLGADNFINIFWFQMAVSIKSDNDVRMWESPILTLNRVSPCLHSAKNAFRSQVSNQLLLLQFKHSAY